MIQNEEAMCHVHSDYTDRVNHASVVNCDVNFSLFCHAFSRCRLH